MRLHRFFICEQIGTRTELTVDSSELVNQIKKVLRLKAGDEVILFDGSGFDYIVAIKQFAGTDQAIFNVSSHSPSRFMPSRKVYLCAALIKKDNFEFVVEKATELGVTDIIPVMAEHSEKKALNQERLIKISVEASEQSGRGDVPKVHPILSLKEAVDLFGHKESGEIRNSNIEITSKSEIQNQNIKTIAFHTEGELFNENDFSKNEPLAIFIGPEGGWSPDEIALFHKNKIEVRCLGAQVLRAETAVIAALSKVML